MSTEQRSLAAVVDLYHLQRQHRLDLARQTEAAEKEEKALKAEILERMQQEGLSSAGGKLLRVTLETEYEPTVTDYTKFYDFIKKHDAFELLQRRVSAAAVKERWADGAQVPGVEKFPVLKLHTSKV